jgi:hypothetical protein
MRADFVVSIILCLGDINQGLVVQSARHGAGCYLTRETTIQMRLMTWRAVSVSLCIAASYTSGPKFEHAVKWGNVHIITLGWVEECVAQQGGCGEQAPDRR